MDRQQLIEQLDPTRDYGGYSHKQLVEKIEEGEIKISTGHFRPVLRDRSGALVRGSDAPLRSGVRFAEWFSALGDQHFEEVLRGLVRSAAEGGDTKAAIWLLNKWIKEQAAEPESTGDLLQRIAGRR